MPICVNKVYWNTATSVYLLLMATFAHSNRVEQLEPYDSQSLLDSLERSLLTSVL